MSRTKRRDRIVDNPGTHPKGCVYGGFSYGYWIIVEGCTLDHPEQIPSPPPPLRCTRCGKTLAGSGSLIAAFLEQPDGTPVCASDCKGGGK